MDRNESCRCDARSGSVLLLVPALLAALIAIAAVLVLTTRTEQKTTRSYTASQLVESFISSLELYSADYLGAERFGLLPGEFRYADPAGEFSLTGNAALPRQHEILFPASEIEELYGTDVWLNSAEVDQLSDYLPLAGIEVEGRFLLHLEDLGGSRLDVNMTGNWIDNGGSGEHVEMYGQTPFETRLSRFFARVGMPSPEQTAAGIIHTRGYGNELEHLSFPGYTPPYPVYPYSSSTNPSLDQYPYSGGDLFDCAMAGLYHRFNSAPRWLERYLTTETGSLLREDINGDLRAARGLTTMSSESIYADFVSDADALFDGSQEVMRWLGRDDFSPDREGLLPFRDGFETFHLLLKRPLERIVRAFEGDAEAGVVALSRFLEYVDGSGAGFDMPDGTDLTQIALNIWNVAAHAEPGVDYVYSIMDRGNTYYGVIPGSTLYVAEAVPTVDSSLHPYIPRTSGSVVNDDGSLNLRIVPPSQRRSFIVPWEVAPLKRKVQSIEDTHPLAAMLVSAANKKFPGIKYVFKFVKVEVIWYDRSGTGNYDMLTDYLVSFDVFINVFNADDTLAEENNPPTGWGKYIKLFNPWDDAISLSGYRLEIDCVGRKWEFQNARSDSEWIAREFDYSIEIDLQGVIPARGHFVIVDNDTFFIKRIFSNIDSANYQVDHRLTHLTDKINGIALYGPDHTGSEVVFMHSRPGTLGIGSDTDYSAPSGSAQIDDPRPCWVRNGAVQTEPWGPDAWFIDDLSAIWRPFLRVWHWNASDTASFDWFNPRWRYDYSGSLSMGAGDDPLLITRANLSFDMPARQNLLSGFYVPAELRNPGDIGFAHAGLPWCTVSLSGGDGSPPAVGAEDIVFLRGVSRYLTGNSPCEYGEQGAPLYPLPEAEGYSPDQHPEYERLGLPVRLHGRVNVNTAPVEVIEALIPRNTVELWDGIAGHGWDIDAVIAEIAGAAVVERDTNGAFENIDDFFDRVPQIFGSGLVSIGGDIDHWPNSPLRRKIARSLYNRITVRSDVWGVTGRVQILDDDEFETERAFYMVIDRSFNRPRVMFRTELPLER